MISLLLWMLYLAASGVTLLAARWLGRPIPVRYCLVFLLLPIAFCLPGFIGGRTLLPTDHIRLLPPWKGPAGNGPRNANLNDAVTQMAPWSKAVRLAWKEGSIPLRNRWSGCGTPLLANGQSGVFSPFSLAALALPLANAFTFAAAWKLFLALAGMWLWLREAGVSREAALFGCTAFAFSTTMTPWLLFPLSAVFCLWPWAFFTVELLASSEHSARAWIALTLIFTCWILAGHPESAALGALAIAIVLGVRLFLRDGRAAAAIPRILAAGALAAAVTAFLWLPELLAIRASNRYPQAEQFRANLPVSLAPHPPAWRYGVLTSLFPRSLGDDLSSPRIAGAGGSFSEMALGYFGIAGWTLALLFFRPGSPRPRVELALVALLVCGLAIGTLTWPVFDLFLSLPLVRLVLPLRFLSWVALGGAGVAAFEVDRIFRDGIARRVSLFWVFGASGLLGAAALGTYRHFLPLHAAAGGLDSQRQALVLCLMTLAATLLLVALSRVSTALKEAAPLLLACIGCSELFFQGESLYRWGKADEIFPPTPLTTFLRSQKGVFRVLGEQSALFPGTAVFAGVEEIRTHDAIEQRQYVEFLDRTCGYDPRAYFKHVRDPDAPVLDFLNVRFLVSGDPLRAETSRWRRVYSGADGSVLENPRALPRVFSPIRVRFVSGSSSAFVPLPSGNWREEATVSNLPDHFKGASGIRINAPVDVTAYRESTNQATLTARAEGEGPAFLVTSLVQDGGWSARDERGRRIPTVLANSVFLGLLLEPGRHELRLRYWPPGFREGAAVSAATLAALVGILGWRRIKRWSR